MIPEAVRRCVVSSTGKSVLDLEPEELAKDFANAIILADKRLPIAVNSRSGLQFQPGLGPHAEGLATQLILKELVSINPIKYQGHKIAVPYPESPRQRCDVCLGSPPAWDWALEVKLVRLLGDNGKLNDNMVMHLLSPYPSHRSALTDCSKLAASVLGERKAVLLYGFETDEFPLEPLVRAFETLAGARVPLGRRAQAGFSGLVHPVHKRGAVYLWEIA
jgi:hypothetical protein